MAHARSHDHSNVLDGSPIAVAGVPNLPASKITSGEFNISRMPRGADGLVLTGTGVGSNPAYEAVAAAAYTDMLSSVYTPPYTDTWEDWDLSAIVPEGTLAVEVRGELEDASTCEFGIRKNGSSDNRLIALGDPEVENMWATALCEVDANRIIEIKTNDVSARKCKYTIIGYWV